MKWKYKGREKEYLKEYRKKYSNRWKPEHSPTRIELHCEFCGVVFSALKYRKNRARFCSYKCYWKFLKDKPNPTASRLGKTRTGSKNCFYGKKHTEETKRKISQSRKGKAFGKDNASWKGGVPRTYHDRGRTLGLANLILKCKVCGTENKKKLIIHHIDFNYKNNNLYNLQIMCNSCHLRFHRKQKKYRTGWTPERG